MNESTLSKIKASLRWRYLSEKIFKLITIAMVCIGILFLVLMLGGLIYQGKDSFTQARITLTIDLPALPEQNQKQWSKQQIRTLNYRAALRESLYSLFPEVQSRGDQRALNRLISQGAKYTVSEYALAHPEALGSRITLELLADSEVDLYLKSGDDRSSRKNTRLSEKQIGWIEQLLAQGIIQQKFNTTFFTKGDSRNPEQAGILGAVVGSFYALLIAFLLSFPLGIATAIYLEEFSARTRLAELIEININNLAAVPSIIFGLLGLAILINFVEMPRSTPLVGGVVLSLMTLPTVIIASRAALKAVPPSIREAALALGASRMQTTLHHVLPLAMPGMLTGSIIGMAQALGETAPLLMIGMMAFIVDVPQTITDPATALPVQVFLWSDSPERAFVTRTAGAILVLLMFLALMNLAAVAARKAFEQRY